MLTKSRSRQFNSKCNWRCRMTCGPEGEVGSSSSVNDQVEREKYISRQVGEIGSMMMRDQADWVDFSEDGKWKDTGLFGVHGCLKQFREFADMVNCVKDEISRFGIRRLSCKERIYSLLTFARARIVCNFMPSSFLRRVLSIDCDYSVFGDPLRANVEYIKKYHWLSISSDIVWKAAFVKTFEVSWADAMRYVSYFCKDEGLGHQYRFEEALFISRMKARKPWLFERRGLFGGDYARDERRYVKAILGSLVYIMQLEGRLVGFRFCLDRTDLDIEHLLFLNIILFVDAYVKEYDPTGTFVLALMRHASKS